jgi:hypothetical protein
VTPEFVTGSYRRLFEIERSFRMSKHDLQARPIYHHLRDSIEAHLTIVFAALAVSRWIEHQTGWSIRKFVKTARRYRTIQIQAGTHTISAADPLPADLRAALDQIHGRIARFPYKRTIYRDPADLMMRHRVAEAAPEVDHLHADAA